MANSQNPYTWNLPIDVPADGPPSGQVLRIIFQSLSSWISGITSLPVFFKGLKVGNGTPPTFDAATGRQTADAPLATLTAAADGSLLVNGVNVSADAGWSNPTFTNAWVNFGGAPARNNAQYRMVGTMVFLRGAIKSGTLTTSAFTLPAGYRPPAEVDISTVSNGAFGAGNILTNGNVVPAIGSTANFSLEGIFFDTLA